MLLSVSVAVTFTFSLLVSSTQVPLGESQPVASPAVWTHPPFCKTSAISNKEFCVYPSPTFAGGRGVSIITTAQVAEDIAKTIPIIDAKFMDRFKNEARGPPHFTTPIPGRGMSVVSNRTLHRAQRVFAKTAVLLIHQDVARDFGDADRIELYHRAVDLLPEETRKMFMELHGHFGGAVDKIDDIVVTNAFQVYLGYDQEPHKGIIPETSRINHDCRPNAVNFFNSEALIHFIHAVRPIYPGEEITIAYTYQMALSKEREIDLRRWGITCTCSLCSSSSMIVEESDRRLNISREIVTDLADWTATTTATVERAETLIAIYQMERLDAAMGEAYKQAALAYSTVGNLQVARKYASFAIEYMRLTSGQFNEEVLVMREFATDPTKHWTWMRRLMMKDSTKPWWMRRLIIMMNPTKYWSWMLRLINMDYSKSLMDEGRETAKGSNGVEEESNVKEVEATTEIGKRNRAVEEQVAIGSEKTTKGEDEAGIRQPSRDEL